MSTLVAAMMVSCMGSDLLLLLQYNKVKLEFAAAPWSGISQLPPTRAVVLSNVKMRHQPPDETAASFLFTLFTL